MTKLMRLRTVSALGVIEIFAWGSSFYLIAVLAQPIIEETGWSAATVSAGLSVGLLVSGIAATWTGRLIQTFGGRPVLAAGMVILALGLTMLGLAQYLTHYFAAWAVLGMGMAFGLYDAAFSTLGRIFGRDARSAITQLTLWGGFASTVCWPLSAWLVEAVGWRNACFSYAALHLVVTVPLALLVVPRAQRPLPVSASEGDRTRPVAITDPKFICLALVSITFAMLATIWTVHFVTLLAAIGYSTAAAIAIGTLLGPAQVGARLVEMLGRGRHHPIWTLLVAALAVGVGLGGLAFGLPAALAMIGYGAGNGLWSITRGSLPLAVFDPEGYARTMGRLAAPTLVASAAAPSIGAYLIDWLGPVQAMQIIAIAATIPLILAVILFRMINREPAIQES